jgi:hypothetical protein
MVEQHDREDFVIWAADLKANDRSLDQIPFRDMEE